MLRIQYPKDIESYYHGLVRELKYISAAMDESNPISNFLRADLYRFYIVGNNIAIILQDLTLDNSHDIFFQTMDHVKLAFDKYVFSNAKQEDDVLKRDLLFKEISESDFNTNKLPVLIQNVIADTFGKLGRYNFSNILNEIAEEEAHVVQAFHDLKAVLFIFIDTFEHLAEMLNFVNTQSVSFESVKQAINQEIDPIIAKYEVGQHIPEEDEEDYELPFPVKKTSALIAKMANIFYAAVLKA